MISLRILILQILFITIYNYGHAQLFHWAGKMGGIGGDFGWGITSDKNGNVYTTGYFNATADLDPGVSALNFTSTGGTEAFVTKTNPKGELIWAITYGGSGVNEGSSITVDKEGNIYVTGYSSLTADFDPGPGTYLLSSAGQADIYVMKLDPNGMLIWAAMLGGSQDDRGVSIAVDENGNVFTTGRFQQTADFDPGPDTYNLTTDEDEQIFISKLDEDGHFVWAKQMGGSGADFGEGIEVGSSGNIYVGGYFRLQGDFDPDTSVFELVSAGQREIFAAKLNPEGQLIWAKRLGGTSHDYCYAIALDRDENLYVSGAFDGIGDFDPGPDSFNLTSLGSDIVITKLDRDGNFIWSKKTGGTAQEICNAIEVDQEGNVYYGGRFTGTADFDPDVNDHSITTAGLYDGFVSKLDQYGQFIWVTPSGGSSGDETHAITIDDNGHVTSTGFFQNTVDFDPGPGVTNQTAYGGTDIFTCQFNQSGITGYLFNDFNLDCQKGQNEPGISRRLGLIQPGSYVTQTGVSGLWFVDSLPPGDYTIRFDTSGYWKSVCGDTVNFTVIDTNEYTIAPALGMMTTIFCTSPWVATYMPFMRRCFDGQKIYFKACNLIDGTMDLENAYVDVQLDPYLVFQNASVPVESLGGNKYRVHLGTMTPGECIGFTFNTIVSCDAAPNQTLCIQVDLFPADSCVYEEETNTLIPGLPPCAYGSERSHLVLEGWCEHDSIHFAILNNGNPGDGDMECFSKIRVLVDGDLLIEDSIRLVGGMSDTLLFTGDGRTWRMEVDQHPGHIGRSNPNATVERCGNLENWTPGYVNQLAEDDANSVTDIFCNIVTQSKDPNDKTGFPIGIKQDHFIKPNTQLQYVVRFQNTGNDTAFTVVILDTLDTDLEIFSVTPGISSHASEFTMYGQRILKWTFTNILLPDSTTDVDGSQGFVTFNVDQLSDLPDGTEIINNAGIYFDFNDPVITNSTLHTINSNISVPAWTGQKELFLEDCHSVVQNDLRYTHSGTFWQLIDHDIDPDTLLTLYVDIIVNEQDTMIRQSGDSLVSLAQQVAYQWMYCKSNAIIPGATFQHFIPHENGQYAVIITQEDCVDTSACYSFIKSGLSREVNFPGLSIYPNPATDYFTIDFKQSIKDVNMVLHDVFGRKVAERRFDDTRLAELPVNLLEGFYFVSVYAQGRTGIYKIIIKR